MKIENKSQEKTLPVHTPVANAKLALVAEGEQNNSTLDDISFSRHLKKSNHKKSIHNLRVYKQSMQHILDKKSEDKLDKTGIEESISIRPCD
jgi:hypothetical protein